MNTKCICWTGINNVMSNMFKTEMLFNKYNIYIPIIELFRILSSYYDSIVL